MRDKDTLKLEMLAESIFSGYTEEEKEDKTEDIDNEEEKEEKEDSEDSEESEDEGSDDEDDDSEDSDEDDEDDDDSDSEEEEDEDSDDSDSNPFSKDDEDEGEDDGEDEGKDGPTDEAGGDKGVQSKIQSLQKQYNSIMQDAFTKYAPECIEDALEASEGAFGEDIEGVLQTALDSLKTKILGDFGIESGIGAGGFSMGTEDEPADLDDLSGPEAFGTGMAAGDEGEDEEDGEAIITFGSPTEEACGMKHKKKAKK